MYRVIDMSGSLYAIELMTSGRSAEDEFEEMEQFVLEGVTVIIIEDYEEVGSELVTRDYL